jgi:hypothetical protein
MRLYDEHGEQVDPRDVLDPEELAEYYDSVGHQWWKEKEQ